MRMGIHPTLVDTIKRSLTNYSAKVLINNNLSFPFPIDSGVRQGDSIALLLFNITLQLFLNHIHTQGIHIQAHADDTALHLRFQQEATAASAALRAYEECSCAQLNWTKSTQLPFHDNTDFGVPFDCKLAGERYLGVLLMNSGKIKVLPETLDLIVGC